MALKVAEYLCVNLLRFGLLAKSESRKELADEMSLKEIAF